MGLVRLFSKFTLSELEDILMGYIELFKESSDNITDERLDLYNMIKNRLEELKGGNIKPVTYLKPKQNMLQFKKYGI
jgi:hypothetical protein